MQKGNGFRMRARSVFRRIFHVLLDRLEIRRFKEHSFFGSLLPQKAVVADFGAHRGEFFAALKSEYSISRALLIEADPTLAALFCVGKTNAAVNAAAGLPGLGRRDAVDLAPIRNGQGGTR